VTFIDLDGREPEGQNFVADLRNYARVVLSIMTEFGVVTHVVEKHSSRGPETPTSQGAGPQRPQIFDSDVNKTKSKTKTKITRQRPTFPEVNKGTWRI